MYRARPRVSWRRLLNLAVAVISVGGLTWLIATQHDQLSTAIAGITHARIGLVVAAVFCERTSMWSFARMQRRLLRAGGHHLAVLSAGAITFAANALSVTVPLAGPGLATAFTYREWGRRQVSRPAAAFALGVSGMLSTVSLLVILAAGALASGNPVAAILGLLTAVGTTAVIGGAVLAVRLVPVRRRLERAAARIIGTAQRLSRRPGAPPEEVVAGALRQLADLHLRRRDWILALGWSFLNWLGDAACLALSIKAVGLPVPLRDLLLVWSAGLAASTINLTPGGAGIVEAALIAALVGTGAPVARAVVAVLIYRLISLWLVILSGWIVFLIIRARRERRLDQPP
ncbi:MAG TPA: YbhN family protein [Trebonia sp.]|nr:YbhN family protein [Trebonia sp.]